ncbi:hypothetical protein ACWDUD_18955 [Rhodococcus sp. NPDC003382]|uniref:hypothetical protein n=1 Tax=unclassified Rhodococcus (in: high G+C Gram-positive bacteria) TaxID=192944 RepID=UPI0018CD54CB|nr:MULTISPECIES: hypothetical protein [unclassified Rhodococcus (in: high G+C Gram-positive bacteria)]MBH0121748.1 hypothetical protein [Rhodococcus sp. CX]MCK8670772.1 hypothetical protein [Rhodococcus sp. HM1]
MFEFAVIVVFMLVVAFGTEPAARSNGAARWARKAWLRLNHFRPQDPRKSEEPVAGEERFVMAARGAPHH